MGREGVGQHARQRQNAKPGMRKIYHNNALHPQLHSIYYVGWRSLIYTPVPQWNPHLPFKIDLAWVARKLASRDLQTFLCSPNISSDLLRVLTDKKYGLLLKQCYFMRVYMEILLFLSESRREGNKLESRQRTRKQSWFS